MILAFLLSAALAQDAPPPVAPPPDAPVDPGPSAARLCAEAASGSQVEVCLELAAAHPDQVDGIAAALRAHIDRGSADDRDILRGLLLLLDDDTGVEGVRLLASLGDPRAVGPLTHTAEHRELPVALEAVQGLARYRDGLEPLSRFLLDSDLPIDVRVASAKALGTMGGDDAADVLLATLRRKLIPIPLRQALIDTVLTSFPERADELDRTVSTDGSVWLAAGAASGLGYTLYATGSFGQYNLSPFGGGAGFLAGGTAGFLAGRAWPMEASDAAFITTTGAAGIGGGYLVGSGLYPHDTNRRHALVGGLMGEGAGFGLAIALRKEHPGTVADSIEASVVAGAAAVAAETLSENRSNVEHTQGSGPDLATGIALLSGMAVGQVVAPHIHLKPNDTSLILLGGTTGFVAGYLLPPAPGKHRWPVPISGMLIGGLAGYGVAPFIDPRGDVLLGGISGLGYGLGFGLGVGLIIDPSERTRIPGVSALVGGTIGAGVGATLANRNPKEPRLEDAVTVGLATGWAGWQAVGWGIVVDKQRAGGGWWLAVPAVVGSGAAIATPKLDIPAPSAFAATSLGLWGGYVAGAAAQITNNDDDVLLFALVGSDAGLLIGAGAMSPVINARPLVIGLADAGGVLGGSVFALGVSFVTDDPDVILGGSFVGAGLGFTGGGLFASRLKGTKDIAWLRPIDARIMVVPAVLPDGDDVRPGLVLQVDQW